MIVIPDQYKTATKQAFILTIVIRVIEYNKNIKEFRLDLGLSEIVSMILMTLTVNWIKILDVDFLYTYSKINLDDRLQCSSGANRREFS
jgi:hypothetical protein